MGETGTDRRWAALTCLGSAGSRFSGGFSTSRRAPPACVSLADPSIKYAATPGRRLTGSGAGGLFSCSRHDVRVLRGHRLRSSRRITSLSPSVGTASPLPFLTVAPVMVGWGIHTGSNPTALRPTGPGTGSRLKMSITRSRVDVSTWRWGWGRLSGLMPRVLVCPQWPTGASHLQRCCYQSAGGNCEARRLWIPFTMCAVTNLRYRGILFGIDFTYQRFTIFFSCIWRSSPGRQRQDGCDGRGLPGARSQSRCVAAAVAGNVRNYAREADGSTQIMERMEPNARTLYFAFEHDNAGRGCLPSFTCFLRRFAAGSSTRISLGHVHPVRYRPEHSKPRGSGDRRESCRIRLVVQGRSHRLRHRATPIARTFSEGPLPVRLLSHVDGILRQLLSVPRASEGQARGSGRRFQ
jgi:hypothetical protein